MPRELALAVDIGGTFTDVTLQEQAAGRAWHAKTPSTPADPSVGFVDGLRLVLDAAGASPEDVAGVLHGTTVATNLILEGKGARTALVTTAGFRHVLEIGRQDIPRAANLYTWVKPRRPVPPARIFEVAERVEAGGRVLLPLDEASVREAAEACRAAQVQAVAICLLHSFAHPDHERRVAEMLREALPGVAVTASVEVLPVVREYERSLATVLNATVMPAVSTYMSRLAQRLREAGVVAPPLIMQSNGGVAGIEAIARTPAVTALSGPAAGVVGAADVAAAAGIRNLITVDIGGTSADICLIAEGRIALTQSGRVGEWPLPLPMVNMVTIGAGGGSIARVSNGALTVGPESAGARPGPACYGQGGEEPTVTDAHLVLGNLPPSLLGGRMSLDRDRAVAAVADRVAQPLGLSLAEAARGILAIADSNMVGAIRVVSVERGHDPRDFTLVPFGGAGPLHGCSLAEMLGMGTVLIPPAPGVLCAEGLLAADRKSEFARTLAGRGDHEEAETAFTELEAKAEAWFAAEGVAPADRRTSRVALMRYEGQGSELAVPWPGDPAGAARDFAAAHETLYGFRLDLPVKLVTVRVEAEGALPPPVKPKPPQSGKPRTIGHTRLEDPAGAREAPVYERASLPVGAMIDGPAIVSQLDATTLVRPGWRAEMLPAGSLLLRRA
jgi:N-methylhydantoinase A